MIVHGQHGSKLGYRGWSGALVSKNDMGQDLTSLAANRAFSRENCLHNGRRSISALSARLMSAYTMYYLV